MNPKSGKAGTPVTPTAPKTPVEAQQANAGSGSASSATGGSSQGQGQSSQSELKDAKPHKEPQTEEEKEQKPSWVEIELKDEEGNPLAGEPYQVVLPDGGTVASGTLDEKGYARIEGIEPGQCKVLFPNLEDDQWDKG